MTISLIGGLIQTAVGTSGGLGARALKRCGVGRKCGHQNDAALLGKLIVMSRVLRIRGLQGGTAVTVDGVVPTKERVAWQRDRAPSIEPKRAGKSGRYFNVLICDSEYG